MSKISEFEIQKNFHAWCQKQPYILEHWHVPNGMRATPEACYKMKTIGLHSGVCDYWVLLQNGVLIAIEFKTDNGNLSLNQEKFIDHLLEAHIPVCVARSTFEATQFIKALLNKTS